MSDQKEQIDEIIENDIKSSEKVSEDDNVHADEQHSEVIKEGDAHVDPEDTTESELNQITDSLEEQEDDHAEEEKSVKEASAEKSSGKGLSIFAILLSMAALGATGYQYYEDKYSPKATQKLNETAAVDEKISANEAKTLEIDAQLKLLSESFESVKSANEAALKDWQLAVDKAHNKAQNSADEKLIEIEEKAQKITSQISNSADIIKAGSIAELIRTSQNKLLAFNDYTSALNGLEIANKELRRGNFGNTTQLINAINTDINSLKSAQSQTSEDVSSQILELVTLVDSLKYTQVVTPEVSNIESQDVVEEVKKSWYDSLAAKVSTIGNEIVDDLSGVVTVKDLNKEAKAYRKDEDDYIRQNAKLFANSAQLAWLNGNETAYKGNLTEYANWISQYFDENSTEFKNVEEKVNVLQAKTLSKPILSLTSINHLNTLFQVKLK